MTGRSPDDTEQQPDPAEALSGPDIASEPEVGRSTPGSAGGLHRQRWWPGAVARALVVLVVAGVGYQLVVPVTATVRSRLARLVVTRTGTAAFPGPPASSTERPASTGSIAALVAAARAHPSGTGLYVATWTAKASGEQLALVVFLLPDAATAGRVRTQVQASQLSPTAFQGSGLTRTASFAPPGIRGAAGSVYATARGATPTGQVAAAAWQDGRAVALVESALTTGSPEVSATAAARAEEARLSSVLPGFTLSVTHRPALASSLWGAGTVVALLLAAGGPVAWRRRSDRAERRRAEELARTIRVGGSTIVRKRRDA